MPRFYFYECGEFIVSATSRKNAEKETGRPCRRLKALPWQAAKKLITNEVPYLFSGKEGDGDEASA